MNFLDDLKQQIASYYDLLIIFLPKLVVGIVVILLMLFALSKLRHRIIRYFQNKADDKLLFNFIDSAFRIINIIFGIFLFLYIIGQSGIANKILGAAGVLSFVIGFAFKDIGENFLAGVMLAFKRPFRMGDTVMTAGVEGIITEMSLRETHLKTFDGKDVYIPNAQILKNPLYNYTIDGFLRKSITLGVDYDSDLILVRNVIQKILEQADGVIQDTKKPKSIISAFGTSTVDITIQYWINTFDNEFSSTEIQSNLMKDLLIQLTENKVNMPGTIMELKNYNNTSLSSINSVNA